MNLDTPSASDNSDLDEISEETDGRHNPGKIEDEKDVDTVDNVVI